MKKENIIINGRRLNDFQRLLFELPTQIIESFIYLVYGLSIISLLYSLSTINFHNQSTYSYIFIATLLTSVVLSIITIRGTNIFIHDRAMYAAKKKSAKEILRSSWIVNREMVFEYLKKPTFKGEEYERTNIIKNSSGHQIFETLKENEWVDYISMFNYMKKPAPNIVIRMLDIHLSDHNGITIKKPFTFAGQSKEDLKKYYEKVEKKSMNDFKRKVLERMGEADLVKYLDEKIVQNEAF